MELYQLQPHAIIDINSPNPHVLYNSEIGPLAARLALVAENLQRATGLAAAQIERLDHLFAGASKRADQTLSLVQGAVVGPLREGLAVVAAIRGVMGAVRAFSGRRAAKAQAPVRRRGPAVHRVTRAAGLSPGKH